MRLLKDKIPPYLAGKILIVGKYSGERYREVVKAARRLEAAGLHPYPSHQSNPVPIDGKNDTFYFLRGGDFDHQQVTERPHEIELGFLRRLKEHHPERDILYVAVPEDGYLGQSATMEVAYAMALKKRFAFSRRPTQFSHRIHPDTLNIVTQHLERYPVLPTEDIPTRYEETLRRQIDHPRLTATERRAVFQALLRDIRELRDEFS